MRTVGGLPFYGVTNTDGVYQRPFSTDRSGAMPKKNRAEIVPVEPETNDNGKPIAGTVIVTIPARYSQSGSLKADVQTGSNSLDFALDSK